MQLSYLCVIISVKLCKHYGVIRLLSISILEHLQTSSDIEGLSFQTELFPLTNVLYTFYEYFMFNDIMFPF